MKILVMLTLVTVVFAMSITTAQAAGLGTVVDPLEKSKISATAEYTHVFGRDLSDEGSEADGYDQAYVNLAYGVTDNIKMYTKLGTADMNIKGKSDDGSLTHEEYAFGFLWGVGASGNFRLADAWILGLDSQYTAWSTDFEAVTLDGEAGTELTGSLDNSEWQAALYAGREIVLDAFDATLLPYVGVKYAQLESDYKGLGFQTTSALYEGTGTAQNDTEFGVVAGTSLNVNDSLKINIEGQFVDETGITAGLTYRF